MGPAFKDCLIALWSSSPLCERPIERNANGIVWGWVVVGVGVFEYLLEDLVIERAVSNPFGDTTLAPSLAGVSER